MNGGESASRPEIVAVVNPISGGGAASRQWPAVEAILRESGVVVRDALVSSSASDAAVLAAR
ncbi:MAG: hypothetical protein QM658_07105, partial [Gordonia sp. (in: high G+C Gram-positive bacteria)]